jgi:hypothetical protein
VLTDGENSNDAVGHHSPPYCVIDGVPHFVLNGSHGLSGAQPPEVLLNIMLEAIRK